MCRQLELDMIDDIGMVSTGRTRPVLVGRPLVRTNNRRFRARYNTQVFCALNAYGGDAAPGFLRIKVVLDFGVPESFAWFGSDLY